MSVTEIVNVTITAANVNVTQEGFGVPLILGTPSWVSDRIRFYSDITGVAADFATTRPEYKAAAALFNQNPRPPSIAVGKLNLPPTQKYTITPVATNSAVYNMYVNDTLITYTADSSATATEICDGLRTALAAAVTAGLVMTCTASGTSTLVLTGNTAGAWDSVAVDNVALLGIAEDHADPDVATDLGEIQVINDSWYAVINPWNSRLMALAIMGWCETNKKLFLCASNDSLLVTSSLATEVAKTTSADIATRAKVLAYKYTSVWYHPSPSDFLDAGISGRCLPLDPGSETWALKTLSGVDPVILTTTHKTNLFDKYANTYYTIAGVNITNKGKVGTGEYIDVVRFIDWLTARMGERIFGTLASPANPKVPYTDAGIALIAGNVSAQLQEGVAVGGLASYVVGVPKARDANPADKAARLLKGVTFTGVLAGAAHTVAINGIVTV